jgi:hypothetical protein
MKAAIVARETVLPEMVNERHFTIRASHRLSAGPAQVDAMKAPAVEKKDGLLP